MYLNIKQTGSSLTGGIKGKPVKTGCGPAAVIGDKLRKMSLSVIIQPGRRGGRMIREPEDLPVMFLSLHVEDERDINNSEDS